MCQDKHTKLIRFSIKKTGGLLLGIFFGPKKVSDVFDCQDVAFWLVHIYIYILIGKWIWAIIINP